MIGETTLNHFLTWLSMLRFLTYSVLMAGLCFFLRHCSCRHFPLCEKKRIEYHKCDVCVYMCVRGWLVVLTRNIGGQLVLVTSSLSSLEQLPLVTIDHHWLDGYTETST